MLSIIIIASIAFTISSILSSTSILQKWFPKHYSLIDGIVFIIISGFVISYFSNYLFDSELWWLIPLIIFGLGLLLRALGVKINRPLLSIRKGKNM
jgi:F0F1-type ATP synthase assembly protein I